ncbi:MAG: hypothetical protein KIS68_01110 [Bauldia sp.]|nr:hypothetical protein [Bauldia sp.]
MSADAPSDAATLQRLRERVELQFHQLETLRRALEAGGRSRTVTIEPRLPPRSSSLEGEAVPPADVTSWWPGSEWPVEPLVPTPGLGSLSLAGRKTPVIAVIVFGLRGADLEGVVEMIATRQRRSADFKPVFLTDCPAFRPFQARGYVMEYLPRAIYGADPHRLRNPRGAARLKLLQSKWDFGATIDLTRDGKETAILEAGSAGVGPTAPPADGAVWQDAPETVAEKVALIRGSGLFDEDWYVARYAPDGFADPIEHYVTVGAALGHDPHPLFRTAYYARQIVRGRKP